MSSQIETCLDALRASPTAARAIDAIREVLSGRGETLPADVREAVERGRESTGSAAPWRAVVALLELQIGACTDVQERSELLLLKGRVLQEELLEGEAALAVFEQARELRPDDEKLANEIGRVREINSNWERVAAGYAQEAAAASDVQLATSLLVWAAEVTWRNDPDAKQIEAYLRQALSVEPRNRKALLYLDRLLREQQRKGDLLQLLADRAQAAASREERVALLVELGDLWAEGVAEPKKRGKKRGKATRSQPDLVRAAEHYRRALALLPAHDVALRRLRDVLVGQQDWADLADIYEAARAAMGHGNADVELLAELGTLYAERLGEPEKAESCFQLVRQREPAHTQMLEFFVDRYRGRAEPAESLALLETAQRAEPAGDARLKLARQMAAVAEVDLENQEKAIDIWKAIRRAAREDEGQQAVSAEAMVELKRLYRQGDPPRWNALRELLKEEIDALGDDQIDRKLQLLGEVVEIYRDHLGQDLMVVNAYNAMLALAPDHRPALEALTERYEAMGRWSDLIGVLERRQQNEEDVGVRIALLRRIAEIWTERLSNQSQAMAPMEQILALDPQDEAARARLKEIHRRRHNWRGLVQLLRGEAEQCTGAARMALLEEAARLASDRLADGEEAVQLWEAVLAEDGTHDEALDALEDRYRRAERWEALGDVLQRKLRLSGVEEDRWAPILEQLGDLYEVHLNAPERAIDTWEKLIDLRPADRRAMHRLKELLVSQERWDDLEGLLGERGRHAELADALTIAAERAEGLETQIALLLKVGELCRDQLANPERAMQAYERVVVLAPAQTEACRALVPLYRATERWERLLAMYEALLPQATGTAGEKRLLAEIRALCERKLGDPALAFDWCARAHQGDLSDEALRGELERLAAAAGAWQPLAELYGRIVAEHEESAIALPLLRKLGDVFHRQIGDLDEAGRVLRQLLELRPDDAAALAQIAEVYGEQQRWNELIEIRRRQAALAPDESGDDVRLLLEVARIEEERLADLIAAITTYEALAADGEGAPEAIHALQRLYRATHQWAQLARALQWELAGLSEGARRTELSVQLAGLRWERLDEREGAVDLLERMIEVDPGCQPAIDILSDYLAQEGAHQPRVAQLLADTYARREAYPELAQTLRWQLAAFLDSERRPALLGQLCSVVGEQLGQATEALGYALELFALDPSDEPVQEQLMGLAARCDGYDRVAEALDVALRSSHEAPLELRLHWHRARVLDGELGRPADAKAHYLRIAELDPSSDEALRALERILRDAGNWGELRDVLRGRQTLARNEETRRDLLRQICAINEDVLDDADAATAAYEELLALEPEDAESYRALERRYGAAERWQELASLYLARLDVEEGDARTDIEVKYASLLASRLDDVTGALDVLEPLVASERENERAVKLLEELLAGAEERRRVTTVLAELFERRQQWERLAEVLLLRRDACDDAGDKIALLARVAEIEDEQLGRPKDALRHHAEALVLDPNREPSQRAVEGLADRLQDWAGAAAAWEAVLGAADPDDLSTQVLALRRLAQVQTDHLGRADAAAQTYERLLATVPDDREVGELSMTALVSIYEDAGRWEELVRVLQLQRGWADSGARQSELLARIGRLEREQLQRPEAAITSYEALLEQDPEAGEALEALEQLYEQLGRWEGLVSVLEQQARLVSDSAARRALLRRMASVQEAKLDDLDGALQTELSVLRDNPGDSEALEATSRLHRLQQQWPELRDALARRLEQSEEQSDEQLDLLAELAAVEGEQLGEVPAAVARYGAMLDRRREHVQAREALERLLEDQEHGRIAAQVLAPHYRDEKAWEALVRALEVEAEQAPSAAERAQLLEQIARLHDEQRADQAAALDAYLRAAKAAVADADQREALIEAASRLAAELQSWGAVADTLEHVLEVVEDERQRHWLHRRAGQVAWRDLQDAGRAKTHFLAAIAHRRTDEDVLSELQELCEEAKEWPTLVGTLEQRASLQSDPDEEAELIVRAAEVLRDELDRPDEAIALFERARALASNASVLDALESLYAARERWQDLAGLLRSRAESAPEGQRRIDWYFALGLVQAEQLEAREAALEAYAEVLQLRPDHEGATAAVEEAMQQAALGERAAAILEPLYRDASEWGGLARVFEAQIAACADRADRRRLVTALAELQEDRLENRAEAFAHRVDLFGEDPADVDARAQVARLGGLLDRWADVVAAFAAPLEREDLSAEVARGIALQIGKIYDERLYQWRPAFESFARVLREDATDEEAFSLIERLLMRHERWKELLAIYGRAADHARGKRETAIGSAREMLLRAARVWEEALEEPSRAIEMYRGVLEEHADDETAIAALDRLYRDQTRWDDLCELLHQRLGGASGDAEGAALRFGLAEVYDLQLGDVVTAIDHYEEVLQLDGNHEGASAALERIVLDPEQRFRIAQILEPIYRERDEWAKLVVIYDVQLDQIDDVDRRRELLREIARLHEERGGSLDLALKALARAFEESGGRDDMLLAEVDRVAERIGAWSSMIELLERVVASSYDSAQQVELLAIGARLQRERIGDLDGSVQTWHRVLTIDGDSQIAVDALLELLGELQRHEALVQMLHRKVEITGDPTVRGACYRRIAQICQSELGEPERAAEAWRQLLTIEEQDASALEALALLYASQENWFELVWVYQQQLALTDDPERWRALQLALARTYEQQIGDPFEAIAALKAAFERDPMDDDAFEGLERLYGEQGLWPDLLETIELRATHEGDRARANLLRYRAGMVLMHELGDLDAAVDRFEDVIVADPEHGATREALEHVLTDVAQRERVAAILERIYEQQEEFAALVPVLEARVEGVSDAPLRRELLARLATVQEERLGDPEAAFASYGRALAEDPADESVQASLDRLAMSLGSGAALVELYEQTLNAIYDAPLARRLHIKLARMVEGLPDEGGLHDDARAERHYRAALDLDPEDSELVGALARVLAREEKHDELIGMLERQCQLASDPIEAAEICFRIAEVYGEKQGDPEQALVWHREALERDRRHGGALAAVEGLACDAAWRFRALEILEPIYEEDRAYAKLVELLQLRLDMLEGGEERSALLERIATLQQEELDDHEAAFATLCRAVEDAPARALDLMTVRLDPLAEQLGRYDDLVTQVDRLIDEGRMPESALEPLGLRCAGWCEAKLGDEHRAEHRYRRLLEQRPECAEALLAVERIYRRRDDVAPLVWALSERAAQAVDAATRRDLLAEVARLSDERLGDARGSIEAWRRLLDSDPSDEEALEALARLHAQDQAWVECVGVLREHAEVAADGARRVALQLRAAAILLDQLGDADRAQEIYQGVLDLDVANEAALAALQGIHRGREDWAAVRDVLLQRLDASPEQQRVAIYRELARLADEELGDFDEAEGFYQQILAVQPEDSDALRQRERLLTSAERWYDLLDLLRQQLTTAGDRGDEQGAVRQFVRMAQIWLEQLDSPDAAIELLEEGQDRYGDRPLLLGEQARARLASGDVEQSLALLDRAAALKPKDHESAELHFLRGEALRARGETESAAQAYEGALALDRYHARAAAALEDLARAVQQWERVAQMLELRQKAAAEGERSAFLGELATLYQRMGLRDRAVDALERARAVDPDNRELRLSLADALIAVDRHDEAETVLQALLDQGKQQRGRLVAPLYRSLGEIAERREQLAAAREHYERAHAADSTHGPTVVAFGRLLVRQGEWEAARRIYRAMLLQTPREDWGIGRADVLAQLGRIHAALGENDKARTMLERALEAAPDDADIRRDLESLKG